MRQPDASMRLAMQHQPGEHHITLWETEARPGVPLLDATPCLLEFFRFQHLLLGDRFRPAWRDRGFDLGKARQYVSRAAARHAAARVCHVPRVQRQEAGRQLHHLHVEVLKLRAAAIVAVVQRDDEREERRVAVNVEVD